MYLSRNIFYVARGRAYLCEERVGAERRHGARSKIQTPRALPRAAHHKLIAFFNRAHLLVIMYLFNKKNFLTVISNTYLKTLSFVVQAPHSPSSTPIFLLNLVDLLQKLVLGLKRWKFKF